MNSNYFVIEEVMPEKETMTTNPEAVEVSNATAEVLDDNLAECPSCGKSTLKVEGGCHSCVNEDCGFSKCDI